MYTRGMLAQNDWSSKGKHSLDYSRHLCVITRSPTSLGNKSSRSFSDSGAAKYVGKTDRGSLNHQEKRKVHSSRRVNVEGRLTQSQVYKADQKFQRKYSQKNMFGTRDLAPKLPQTGRKPGPMCSARNVLDIDDHDNDDARSLCDSVYSMACSSIVHMDKQEKWTRDAHGSVDKIAKFDAIENWLQNIPKSVLKPGSGRLM